VVNGIAATASYANHFYDAALFFRLTEIQDIWYIDIIVCHIFAVVLILLLLILA
jgi:hypothetical protein